MELTDVTFVGPPVDDRDVLDRVPAPLRQLLEDTNGLVAFEGGFHLRGACHEDLEELGVTLAAFLRAVERSPVESIGLHPLMQFRAGAAPWLPASCSTCTRRSAPGSPARG